jgi:hypothetical protein
MTTGEVKQAIYWRQLYDDVFEMRCFELTIDVF